MDVEAIYNDHYSYIRRACYSFVKNWADAEDVTQDTFIIAMRKQPKVYSFKAIRSWLYCTARYLCLNHLAKAKRWASFDDAPDVPVLLDLNEHIDAEQAFKGATRQLVANLCRRLQTQFA